MNADEYEQKMEKILYKNHTKYLKNSLNKIFKLINDGIKQGIRNDKQWKQ